MERHRKQPTPACAAVLTVAAAKLEAAAAEQKEAADGLRQMALEAQTVRMVRDEPAHPKGLVTADVHPSEVEYWREYGWRLA